MKEREMKIQDILLRIFLLFSLFFPMFYSPFDADYLAEYFVGLSVAYLFLTFYLIYQTVKQRSTPKVWAFWTFLAIVILYNLVSLYFNVKYLHWYGEQINNTIGFLFFVFLVGYGDRIYGELESVLPFFIKAFTCSNILSILYFAAGYTSFLICNNHLIFYQPTVNYYEFRHYWLYSHKSDYSVMLLCFLAVCLCYRKRFKKKYSFWVSMAVLAAALIIAHSWTGYLAGMVLVAGAILDAVDIKKVLKSRQGRWGIGLVAAFAAFAAAVLLKQRNIFTLGNRLFIWKAVFRTLKERPQGLGFWFGEYPMEALKGWNVTNAHNVFLNQMLRFSIPVGVVFTVLFLLIAGYCIYKSRTWLAAGMWLAVLLVLNMDYSLLSYEVAMVLLCAYMVCIFPGVRQKMEAVKEKT